MTIVTVVAIVAIVAIRAVMLHPTLLTAMIYSEGSEFSQGGAMHGGIFASLFEQIAGFGPKPCTIAVCVSEKRRTGCPYIYFFFFGLAFCFLVFLASAICATLPVFAILNILLFFIYIPMMFSYRKTASRQCPTFQQEGRQARLYQERSWRGRRLYKQ